MCVCVCVCVYMHEYVIQCMSVCLHKLNYVYGCAQYVCVYSMCILPIVKVYRIHENGT